MNRNRTQKLILCALFAAMTAVLSQIAIPIGPVPVNLATFAVYCAGAILGAKMGAVSMAVWALLGVVGIPVFTMFRSGPGTLLGPTGGFILGYVVAAFLIGLVVEKGNKHNRFFPYPLAMLLGAAAFFLLGTGWFMISTHAGIAEALSLCVLPFIPGDLVKIVLATVLAHRLRPLLSKPGSGSFRPKEDAANVADRAP